MTKQKEFENAIHNNDVKIIELLLNNKEVNPSNKYNYAIGIASKNGYINVVKLLLNDKRVNPSDKNNYAISTASENGHTEIFKLLLKNKKNDPSDDYNSSIYFSSQNGHTEITNLLWKDQRVNSTLEKDNKELYNKLIISTNQYEHSEEKFKSLLNNFDINKMNNQFLQ